MCGIVGILGPQEDSWLDAMNGIQRHRGPDDSGVFRDRDVALAMRRLAIVDIAGGAQPMTIDDGRYVLVFNGEIYNAPELRRELLSKDEKFRSDHSDTEVLLHLLAREGQSALRKLNGMFAFALYDRKEDRLLCARDRMGIKPLYYTASSGRFAFASELKSLLALPFVGRCVDRESLFHYLSLMYVPGGKTILDGIFRLPPGHLLIVGPDRTPHTEKWWAPSFAPDRTVSRDEWPGRIAHTLNAAARRWTMSDVPFACSLSGGLDSSGLVGLLSRSGMKLKTVSVGFTGVDEDKWNELPIARAVARMWDTDHTEIVLDPATLLDALPAMAWHLDEPYGGGLPSWSVFEAMSRSVKVGLTGTGGDELFGNYGKWRGLEGGLFDRLMGGAPVDESFFKRAFSDRLYYFSDPDKRAVFAGNSSAFDTSDFLWSRYRDSDGKNPCDRVAQLDMGTQLAEEFLMMTDRFSMAHSLEARTPFLDNEMVDLALSIPANIRTGRRDLKALLRKALADVLPPEAIHAPKRGFVIPLTLWLRGALKPLCERLLSPARLERQGLFHGTFHDLYVRPHLEGRADNTNKVWAMLMFQLWHHVYLERPNPLAAPPAMTDIAAA